MTERRKPRPRPRPRFVLRSPHSPTEVATRINDFVHSSSRVRGIAFDHRIELAIDGEEHHFWSPQVVAKVAAADGGGAEIDARFGPDPYVWAMYVFGYGTLAAVSVFSAMFGIAQLTLHQPATAFFVAPAAAVLAGLVFGASFVGQGLGSDQMYFLRATLAKLTDSDDPPV